SHNHGCADSLRDLHRRGSALLFVVLHQLSKGRARCVADAESLVTPNERTRASLLAILRVVKTRRVATIVVGSSGGSDCCLARRQPVRFVCRAMGVRITRCLLDGEI